MTFEQLVGQAKLATPCGILTPMDRDGLVRRGVAMGITESAAIEIVGAVPCATHILEDWKRVKR